MQRVLAPAVPLSTTLSGKSVSFEPEYRCAVLLYSSHLPAVIVGVFCPRRAAWGVTPFRGRTVLEVSCDLVGFFQSLVCPSAKYA